MREVSWKSAVADLAQAPQYHAVVAKVRSLAYPVPVFTYSGESNIEEIKFKLAANSMLDLVLSILQPKGNADE